MAKQGIDKIFALLLLLVVFGGLAPTIFSTIQGFTNGSVAGAPSWFGVAFSAVVAIGLIYLFYNTTKQN